MYDPFGYPMHGYGDDGLIGGLGHWYLLHSDGQLSSSRGPSTSGIAAHGLSNSPLSTLVGTTTGLEIDLMWDVSVRTASDWSAIESAVTTAAKIFTSAFSDHVVLNIAVGLGEVGGALLGSGALGESESNGYIVNYQTAESALTTADAGLLTSHGSQTSVLADAALSAANFFITSAEAKALHLVSGASTAIDGYIGLTNSPALLDFPANGAAIKSTQYDAVGVAAHEISEVMGRIGMQGETLGQFKHVYTPLDLFRYSAVNTPALSVGNGYFSIDRGKTNLNTYNNPANGGDSADWASRSSNTLDALDAFANPGVLMNLTATDLLQVASLGYQVVAGALHTTAA